ncbi:MAG TPA: hypothetical protein PLI09_27475, partial [Candidatus Hydrogenedentes bacterium]|nr:hypothetical protein [Candidatus Hydrogenedentota bacterium]
FRHFPTPSVISPPLPSFPRPFRHFPTPSVIPAPLPSFPHPFRHFSTPSVIPAQAGIQDSLYFSSGFSPARA